MKDGSSIKLYVDGVLSTTNSSLTATGTLTSNSARFVLGLDQSTQSGYFDGLLDDFRIYNYARTPAQIIQDINGVQPPIAD